MRKTLAFYGAHPSLRERIQIRAARRELQPLHTSCGQALAEFSAELGIAVVEHIAMVEQIPRFVVHCVASHLRHPLLRGMTRDASQAHAPGLQMQEEQNVVRHQASPRQHSTVKKSVPASTSMCRRTNSFQVVVCPRLGAGAMSWRRRMLPTVWSEMG